jgi:hypothetical protein
VEKPSNMLEQSNKIFANINIDIKLDRYLVGEAGSYSSKVFDKKYREAHLI